MPDTSPSPDLFSCSEIARRLQRNTSGVWRVIRRMKLAPDKKTDGGHCFYYADKIPMIEAAFRRGHCHWDTQPAAAPAA